MWFICSAATSVSGYPSAPSSLFTDVVWWLVCLCMENQTRTTRRAHPFISKYVLSALCTEDTLTLSTNPTSWPVTNSTPATTPAPNPASFSMGNFGRPAPNPASSHWELPSSDSCKSCIWVFSTSLGSVPDNVALMWWRALPAFTSPLVQRHCIYYLPSIRNYYCKDYLHIELLFSRSLLSDTKRKHVGIFFFSFHAYKKSLGIPVFFKSSLKKSNIGVIVQSISTGWKSLVALHHTAWWDAGWEICI